jgi:hypothetical protein
MWSNDYPHDEGTYLESKDTIDRLFAHVSAADQEKLLWSNASALYGLEAGPILAERLVLNDGQRKSAPQPPMDTANP